MRSAAEMGFPDIVKLLLKRGANVNPPEDVHDSALSLSSRHGYAEIVNILLKARADVNVRQEDGSTALIEAVTAGYADIVQRLLDAGADTEAIKEPLRNWPLGGGPGGVYPQARTRPSRRIPPAAPNRRLIYRFAPGGTALILAARSGRTEIVRQLLKAGANVNACAKPPPLYPPYSRPYKKTIHIMSNGQPSQFAPDPGGTALLFAAENGFTDIVRLLLAHHARVDIPNAEGDTALSLAKRYGYEPIVRMLEKVAATPPSPRL